MKWFTWIAVGLTVYLALVMFKLPAQFGLWLVDVPKDVQIQGVSGTVWQGQINRFTAQGITVEQVKWQVHPLALFTGKAELEINAGTSRTGIKLQGVLGANHQGWFASGVTFSLPAALVTQLYPMPIKLQGDLQGKIVAAKQGEPWCSELDGLMNWTQGEINAPLFNKPLKLDDTRAILSCDAGKLVAQITDQGGVLGLSVNASLSATDYLLEGEMKPGAEFPQEFNQGLMFFASPMGNGRHKIKLNGSL